ncbi:MAG: L-threonylcarbamoyladenylate synthase [Candidatus Anammoxibacter sp.]
MTKVLDLSDKLNYRSFIEKASSSLKNGKIIAFPTETVYGIGVNAKDDAAIVRLYEIKKRPLEKKITILMPSTEELGSYVDNVPMNAKKLINRFWPGPLTIVLPGKNGEYIGLRVPDHKVVYDLLRIANIPIAAPSANISGQPPATNANAVFKTFQGLIDIILDYGTTTLGKASTVVRINSRQTKILRCGAIPDKDIYDCITQ